jgi:hypothetical protein
MRKELGGLKKMPYDARGNLLFEGDQVHIYDMVSGEFCTNTVNIPMPSCKEGMIIDCNTAQVVKVADGN